MASRITRAARMQPCTLRLPQCRNDLETTVFAHAPSTAKGMGIKSPDFWGAFACSHCHDIVDGRVFNPLVSYHMIDERWLRGIFETQSYLIDKGLITIG